MKRPSRTAYVLLLSSFIGWLSTGCDNTSFNEATPQSACRIQRLISISKSKFFDQTSQTTYEYDPQGNLVKTAATIDKRPTSGTFGAQTGTVTTTYTYDADGYLTTSTTDKVYITTANKTTREQITTTKSYSYADGRLAKYTDKSINSQGTTIITTAAYAYTFDSAGDLTQITSVDPTNPNGSASIWTYQKNKLVDYVEGYGTSKRHPYTIEDGLVTKSVLTIPGSSYDLTLTAAFDSRQRIIKREEYHGTQLEQYDVQTWSGAKPASASLPSFKGFPAATISIFSEQTSVLATRKLFYWNSMSKTMEQYNETVHAVQANAQGFVTNDVIKVNHPNPAAADQDYTITETYTYTGCQ